MPEGLDSVEPGIVAPAHEGPHAEPLSRAGLLIALGAILLVLGSFLPWVTVGAFWSISGVGARWGLITLFTGLALLVIAVQLLTGRLVQPSRTRALAVGGVVLGVLSVGLALYVGLGLRDAIAESDGGTAASESADNAADELDGLADDFADSLKALFEVGTGAGLYTVGVGGILGAAAAGLALRRSVA